MQPVSKPRLVLHHVMNHLSVIAIPTNGILENQAAAHSLPLNVLHRGEAEKPAPFREQQAPVHS
jgi:hypothetical protein